MFTRCQDRVVREMRLPPTVACNEALSENIFMMVVCMELRIPLFIIGKPGSSKSLARQVLADAMEGPSSYSTLFKKLKKVVMDDPSWPSFNFFCFCFSFFYSHYLYSCFTFNTMRWYSGSSLCQHDLYAFWFVIIMTDFFLQTSQC